MMDSPLAEVTEWCAQTEKELREGSGPFAETSPESPFDLMLIEREIDLSDFARPPKSRRVREKARFGRPMGFTPWSNEE